MKKSQVMREIKNYLLLRFHSAISSKVSECIALGLSVDQSHFATHSLRSGDDVETLLSEGGGVRRGSHTQRGVRRGSHTQRGVRRGSHTQRRG